MFHTGFTSLNTVCDYRDTLTYDKVKLSKFISGMHNHKVRIIGRGLWYISAVHTEQDIDLTLSIADEVLKQI